MAETKLIIEVATDHHVADNRTDNASIEILTAIAYTSSLMDLLRMARDLDQIKREGDQSAFNEGVLTVCQVVKGLQDLIHKNISIMHDE